LNPFRMLVNENGIMQLRKKKTPKQMDSESKTKEERKLDCFSCNTECCLAKKKLCVEK